MVLLQKFQKPVQKIGNQSLGFIIPKAISVYITWFKKGAMMDVELHCDEETNEEYLIVRKSNINENDQ